MSPEQIEKLRDRLSFVEDSNKEFDTSPSWKVVPDRMSSKLMLVTAIRLRGTLRGGVSIRLKTPLDAWEEDVYGHIEVQAPRIKAVDETLSHRMAPLARA